MSITFEEHLKQHSRFFDLYDLEGNLLMIVDEDNRECDLSLEFHTARFRHEIRMFRDTFVDCTEAVVTLATAEEKSLEEMTPKILRSEFSPLLVMRGFAEFNAIYYVKKEQENAV